MILMTCSLIIFITVRFYDNIKGNTFECFIFTHALTHHYQIGMLKHTKFNLLTNFNKTNVHFHLPVTSLSLGIC